MSELPGDIPHYPQDNFDKSPEEMDEAERIAAALDLASRYGGNGISDTADHKMWVIDQVVRVLTGCPLVKSEPYLDARQNPYTVDTLGSSEAYQAFIAGHNAGEDGPETLEWDTGIAP